jgi:hypothetical protein
MLFRCLVLLLVDDRLFLNEGIVFYLRRRRARSASAPEPTIAQVEGSGTAAGLNVREPPADKE